MRLLSFRLGWNLGLVGAECGHYIRLFIAAAWQGSDAEIFSRIVSLRCSPAECGKTLFGVSRAHPDQDGLA